jgi:hypothetical protein
MLTPFELHVLLHHYTRPGSYSDLNPDTEVDAIAKITASFIKNGIIEEAASQEIDSYSVTDKGCAWLHCILSVPQPVQKWVQPNGEPIPGA